MINIYTKQFYPSYNTYNRPVSKHYTNLQPLKKDTVNFTSKNLLSMNSKKITNEVKKAVLDNQKLGYGSEGDVYTLPNTDYCVKIYNGENINNLGEWKFNISSQDKINHVVAKSQNGSVIMKQLKGEPLQWNKPDEIYNLQKKSYRNLFIQLSNAYDECLKFDKAPSNLIYNKKAQSLTAIDFFEPSPDIDIEYKPLSSVFECLMARENTPKSKKLNKSLGKNILNVVLDELSSKHTPEFKIDKNDVEDLYYNILATQNFTPPKEIKQLKKAIDNKLS